MTRVFGVAVGSWLLAASAGCLQPSELETPAEKTASVDITQPADKPAESLAVESVTLATPAVAAPAKPETISLFDGKTLTNWKKTEFGGEGEVTVADGQITLDFGSEMTGITFDAANSKIELPKMNYDIEADCMRVDGNDFFCGLTFQVGDSPCSFIVGGWGGGVVGISSIDHMDASENATTKFMEFKKGQWYHIKVRVTPDHLAAWIDKEQVVDIDIKGNKISIRGEVDLSRPLGFATYATKGAIKNIQLTKLPAE